MLNSNSRKRLAVAIAMLSAPALSFSAGYALNEQSASAMGLANAGAAANAENASVMFFNPAGIALLEKAQFSGGMTYLQVRNQFQGSATNTIGQAVEGTNGGEYVPSALIPNMYFSTPINDTFRAGIGVYAPFGVAGDYDDNFTGRFFANFTEVQVLAVQPTIAMKVNDELAVGVGVTYNYVVGTLTKGQEYSAYSLAPYNIPSSLLQEGRFHVSGDDTAFGWNAGVIYQPTASTTIGLNYRSKVDFDLEGDAHLSNVPVATGDATNPVSYAFLSEQAHMPLVTPESATFSIKQSVTDAWTLYAGATWTAWSRFQNLDIFTSETDGSGSISSIASAKFQGEDYVGHVPEHWKDVWAFSLGASYQLNPNVTLKAGYAHDESPIQSEFRTARVPSTDRNWLTVGAQYNGKDWTVDGAFGYLIIDSIYVDEHEYTVAGEKIGAANLQARYEMEAMGAAVQLTKRF